MLNFFTLISKVCRRAFWPLVRLTITLSLILSTFLPVQAAPPASPVQHLAGDPLTQVSTPTPTATATPLPDLIFADGFETGDLSAWTSSQTDGGDLSASSAAALVGATGMQAVLNDNTALYVTDTTP